MVTIDSGRIEASNKFREVPRSKWESLVRIKRDFLFVSINYDCRCLIEFCEEAEEVYAELGYASSEEMIREGYELDPSQIELAVAWLKHNEPQKQIGLKAVAKKADEVRTLHADHPDWTQQQIADEVGCSQPYVAQVISKNSESEESVIPDHLKSHTDKADFRKLPPELQQQVRAKEVSLNAAAIKAGIRKRLSQAEICVKAFRKAENRLEVIRLILAELEECELACLRDLMEELPCRPIP